MTPERPSVSTPAHTRPEVLAEFMLLHDLIVGVVGVSDRILRFVDLGLGQSHNLIATLPRVRTHVRCVGHRLPEVEW